MIKLSFSLMLLATSLLASNLVLAEFVNLLTDDGDVFEIGLMGQDIDVDTQEQAPNWLLEKKGEPTPQMAGYTKAKFTKISDKSSFCARIRYFQEAGQEYVYVPHHQEAGPTKFHGGNPEDANCDDEKLGQLEFEIHIEISDATRRFLGLGLEALVKIRIQAEIPGDLDDDVPVESFPWRLLAEDSEGQWRLVGGLNLRDEFRGSRWVKYAGSDVRFILVLRGEAEPLETLQTQPTVMAEPPRPSAVQPVELWYGIHGGLEAPADKLKADGQTWTEWTKNTITNNLVVGWETGTVEPAQLTLCEDASCNGVIENLPTDTNPLTILRSQIPGNDRAYLIVEWKDLEENERLTESGAEQAPVTVSDSKENLAFSIAPSIAFGAYARPLTSCLGRLQSAGRTTVPFKLRQGEQALSTDDLLQDMVGSDVVDIIFDTSRRGGGCPLPDLEIRNVTLESLTNVDSDGLPSMRISTNASLFVGYVQLTGAEYRDSLARWRDLLEFYNQLYIDVRETGGWIDGIIYGPGERSGIQLEVEPSSNFVTQLLDDTSLIEKAKSLQLNTQVKNEFFYDKMIALKSEVGDAAVSIVYFDDYPGVCGEYAQAIAESGLTVDNALIISATDRYTGAGALRELPDRLAYVCEEGENFRAYGINWRERQQEVDWDKAFKAIADDWKS